MSSRSPRQNRSQGSWQKDLERLVGGPLPSVKNPEGLYRTLTHYPDDDERLMMMINSGEIEVAKRLVEKGGVSPQTLNLGLAAAAQWGLDELIAFLLKQPGITQDGLNKALNVACDKSRLNAVRLLIQGGADVNNTDRPLEWAMRHDDNALAIVRLLLDSGADLHAKDDQALEDAVTEELYEIAKLLLERGANANAAGGRPLEYAIRNADGKMIVLLVKYGADWTELLSPDVPRKLRDELATIIKQRVIAEAESTSNQRLAKNTPPQSPRKTIQAAKTSPKKQTEEKSGSSQAPTQERPQCAAITQAGTQCTFKAKEGSRYCGKHQK